MITLLPSRLLYLTAILCAIFPFISLGQTTTYSTTGANTYTVPAGATCITVQIWGAGGAGGSRTEGEDGGGGGGGGGYSTYSVPVTAGQVINLFVGAGGTAVTGNNNGNAGQSSWFSSSTLYFAGGGAGGTWGALTVNGTGGAGGTGNTYNGGNGGAGRNNGSGTGGGGGAAASTTSNGPNGVDGAAGAGAGGNSTLLPDPAGNGGSGGASNGNGVAGQNPGGGGGGSGSDEGAGDRLGGAGGNGQIIVTVNALAICANYCTNAFPTGVYPITNVTFNTINNTTSGVVNGTPAAQDFTGTCTSVTQGQTYNLSVSAVGAGAPNTFYLQAYFDWNLDGDFSDANESQAISSYTATPTTATVPITIPCGAVSGRSIQMRIVNHFNTIGAACETAGYGQAEYYCLTIVAATTPIANAGPDQNLNCVSGATLDATASSVATGYWTLISGQGTITTPTSQTSTVTGLGDGANVFQWTATGSCSNATDQVTITASGLPTTPAYAGLDMASCAASIVLSGSDPAPGTGLWTVAGPNTPTFTPDATASNATITGMVAGTYTFTWNVTVAGCAAYTDAFTLQYGSLPTPNAGIDQTICPTGTALAATGYTGLTGTWSSIAGPNTPGFANANSATTNTYGMIAGTYTLQWCLSGGGCPGSACDNVSIQVNACTTAVTHSTTTDQTYTGCSYTYTDNGGAGNYANGISQTMTTFCPDNPSSFATMTITAANFAPGDYMVIYDSDQPGEPIVAACYYDGSPGGGMIYSPALNTTITSSTGCLYVQMNSTAATNTSGFTANIGCSLTQGVQNQTFVTRNNCGGGGGITLCASGSVDAVANQNTNPPDLGGANSGCLGSQEGASNTWVYIVAETSGYIAFQIAPAGGQDFDYAIWGPYDGGYTCPGMTLDDPIRCSWAANGGAGCPATIGIGAQNSTGTPVLSTDVSEGGTCSATNEGWTYPILATAGDVYVVLFQNYSYNNSTFDFTVNSDPSKLPAGGSYASLGCTPPVPLPVELISFTGDNKNRKNYLYWYTASEFANDYYTIERSDDGLNWTVLTIVDGAGFSQEVKSYSTVDEHPFWGVTYYRLKQTDFDGTIRTYKTISINNEIDFEALFSDIYPNPAKGSFFFNYGGKDFNSEITVRVIDASGKVVLSEIFSSFNASQSLEINSSDLESGVYQVEMIQNGKREIKKLSIM